MSRSLKSLFEATDAARSYKDLERIREFEYGLLDLFMVDEHRFACRQTRTYDENSSSAAIPLPANDDASLSSQSSDEDSSSAAIPLPADDDASLSSQSSDDEEEVEESDYNPSEASDSEAEESNRPGRLSIPLPLTAETLHRTNISPEAAAKLLTAALHDLGEGIVVTAKKLRGEKERAGEKSFKDLKDKTIYGAYFDCKQDDTAVMDDGRRDHETIGHCSIVLHYPDRDHEEKQEGVYVGFVVPPTGKGVDTASSIVNYFDEALMNYAKMVILGCDGTVTNTGHTEGALAHFQRILKRALFLMVCMLHHVELPLRHLVEEIDGPTKGPEKYSGPIGQLLDSDVWKLPVGDFEQIPDADFPLLPAEVFKKMSNDAKYLYRICLAIVRGIVPSSLKSRKIGKMVQSRWLTLASRICRLYISCTCSLPNLKRFVTYIVKVYYKTYAEIKHKNSVTDGPTHLLLEIQRIRENCTDLEKKIALKTVANNCYFAHPDAVIIGMLGSEDRDVRESAVDIITDIRMCPPREFPPRKYYKPVLNRNADKISKLCNIKKCVGGNNSNGDTFTNRWIYLTQSRGWQLVHEPPLTKGTDVSRHIEEKLTLNYPCHTQTVEAAVALTSSSVKQITGTKRQRNSALAKANNRRTFPGRVTVKRMRARTMTSSSEDV